jgi:hypothetical protein
MSWLQIVRHIPDLLGGASLFLLLVPILLENLSLPRSSRLPSRAQEDGGEDLQKSPDENRQNRTL